MSWGYVAAAAVSVVGGAMSAKGSRDAANTAAAGSEREIEFNRESRDLVREDQRPYREAGYTALDALMSLTGLGGGGGGGSAPTSNTYTTDTAGFNSAPGGRARHVGSRASGYAPMHQRYMGGPTNSETMYNVSELGPENIYSGGRVTRPQQPSTIDGKTGYVEPNIKGLYGGGFTNEAGVLDGMAGHRYPGPDTDLGDGRTPGTGGPIGPTPRYPGPVTPPNPTPGMVGGTAGMRGTNLGSGGYNGDINADPTPGDYSEGSYSQTGIRPPPSGNTAGSTAIDPATGYPRENPGGVEGGYQFQTDPGYQFRFSEGMRALDRGAAARGGLLSGGYGRQAIRYGQGFASNEYSNVYNRIANIAGLGQTSNQASGNAAMMAGQNMGTAAAQGGYARASGYQGSGNAWANTGNQLAQMPWGEIFNRGGGGSSGVYYTPSGVDGLDYVNVNIPYK